MASPDDIDPAELDALNEQALAALAPPAQPAMPVPGVPQSPEMDELDALNEQALAGMRASAPAAPAVAIAAPAAESAAPERINVVGEAGDIRNVAPEGLAAAEQAGYRRAGELELQATEERQYAESAAGIAQTAAEQAAQGATLGGYGLAAGLVDEGYQQRLEQRAEYNPITAGVAQVVGAAAPALLSGGTSLGARALAATPAAALERLGARAGTSAAKYFGGGAIVRGAVAGAVEGGLGNAAMEAAAGEDPVDVLKAMGTGVALGGALGGAFGAAERGVEKIRGKLDAFAGQRAALRTQAEVDALHALDAQTAPPPEVTAENLLAAQETGLLGELPTDRLAADVQPVLDEINTAAAETSSAVRRDLNAALPKVTRDNVAQYVDDLEANARITARERLSKSAPDQLEAIRAARGELDDELDDIAREIERRRNRIYDVRDKIDTDDALDAKLEKVARLATEPPAAVDAGPRIDVEGDPEITWIRAKSPKSGPPNLRAFEDDYGAMMIGDSGDPLMPNLMTVGNVKTRIPRSGLGTRLYATAYDVADGYGKKLASDVDRSVSAESWWRKQAALGNAHLDENIGRYILDRRPSVPGKQPAAAQSGLTNPSVSESRGVTAEFTTVKSDEGKLDLMRNDNPGGNPYAEQETPPGYLIAAQIDASKERIGYGTKLYAAGYDIADSKGMKLASDITENRSGKANGWWEKQVRLGNARYDDGLDRYVLERRPLPPPPQSAPLPVTPAKIAAEIQKLQDAVSSTRAAYGDAALAADGGTAALRRVELQIADMAPKVASALEAGDMAKAYAHLDRLKRVTQRVAKRTKSREVQQILREKEEIFRQFLMDESQWGQIAVLQREFNGPWADYFLKSGDSDIQSLTKMRSGERAIDPYETAERVNGSAMRGFLDGIGSQKTETAERAWRSELAADVKDLVNRARLVGTDADQALATQAAEDAVAIDALSTRFAEINAMKPEGQRLAKLQEDLEKAAKQEAREATKAAAQAEKEAARDARDVAREQRERAADIERKRSEREDAVSTIGAAMGAAIGGAPGAAIGFALGKLPKVIRAGKTLLAQGDQLANERVVAAASGFLRATQRAVAATGRAVPVGAAISASRVADALARATELADPESPASAELTSKASKLDVVRPGLGAAYAQAEMTRAAFIASKMPPTPPPAVIGRAPRMDPISERKLNRYVAAAYYPEKALARVANGSSTLEDRQVLQVLYPQRWQAFVSQVEDQLARAKRPPTYAQRARIAHQTGIVTMPSADPANIPGLQAVADANAADAIAAVKGESAPASDYRPRKDPNKVFGTRADEVLSGD